MKLAQIIILLFLLHPIPALAQTSAFANLIGPASAPTGTCITNGQWAFSQDGKSTWCNAGTWTSFGGSGSMVYPAAGVPNSTGTAWGTSYAVGTAASDLVQLNASGQLPAVSAVNLTSYPYTSLTGAPTIPTTADWPNAGACTTNEWVTALVNGAISTCLQPAFSNLSGTATAAQIPTALSNTTSVNGTTIPASVTLTQTICSGTIALGTTAIASGAAATTVTATCTGLATTDNIELDFNASPLAVTGYVPSTSGMLTIVKWPTANTINVAVVNNTGSSITPGAITLNYRVVR